MADVTIDPQNSNPKELFGQGVRAYVLQDYDTAVRAFSKISEILSAEHNNEIHDSLGDVYLYYGKALLELSRKESGPLGDGVLKTVDEGAESEEIEESEGEEDAEKPDTNSEDKPSPQQQQQEKEEDEKKNEESKLEEEEEEKKEQSKLEEEEEPNNSNEEKKDNEENEELTDLQVAWEVLELAKKIFTNRGDDGRKNLAETLIVLGEISLESGNFPSAIEDITEGLKIQKLLFGNDSRTIAETYYKLGGALSTNGQIDEAIESFKSSLEYLNNKVSNLQKDEENKEGNAEEIAELNGLIPEVQEKIVDMKNLKLEVTKKDTESVDATVSATNGSGASSSKQATDISHLVKRKRKGEDDVKDENPLKKPSP